MRRKRTQAAAPASSSLAARWPIVPCRGKVPLVRWREITRPRPELLEEFRGTNWAVRLGPETGLACLDIDTGAAGLALLDRLRLKAGAPPLSTPWHTTRRGYHFYFKIPPGLDTDQLPKTLNLAPGVELKLWGLALVPPSRVGGVAYRWRIAPGPLRYGPRLQPGMPRIPISAPPAPIPPWLLDGPDADPPGPPPPARTLLDELLRSEELARWLTERAGSEWRGLGAAIRCPIHQEDRPSASWIRTTEGRLVLRDWHRREGRDWFGIAEVAARILETRPDRALALAARKSGLLARLAKKVVLQTEKFLKGIYTQETHKPPQAAHTGPQDRSVSRHRHIYYSYFLVQSRGGNPAPLGELLQIWSVFSRRFLEAAARGKLVIALSKRELASQAGISPSAALRGARTLALLGLVRPLPLMRGNRDGKPLARRWVLCIPDPESFSRRLELLRFVPIYDLNRENVAIVFGGAVANEVFPTRLAENPKTLRRSPSRVARKERGGEK